MSKKSLLILLMMFYSWLPWTKEAQALLWDKRAQVIFTGHPEAFRGGCCDWDEASMWISSTCGADALPMVILHESQHLLAYLYANRAGSQYLHPGTPYGWVAFTPSALVCAQEMTPARMKSILKVAALGPGEFHAQLPWLLHGQLCPELQRWYPWFDLAPMD